MTILKVACIQTNPQDNIEKNLDRAFSLVRTAAQQGARYIVLPEVFAYMGTDQGRLNSASALGQGVFEALGCLARDLGVYLVGGSHAETIENQSKVYNTCAVYNPSGEMLSHYRKMHLFNLWGPRGEKMFCENDVFCAGDKVGTLTLPECNALLAICYDVRFPEYFRTQKSDVIFLPAAFTHHTGRDHWEILVRARAIENQCFVVACNQTGFFAEGSKRNYGHSMIVDPWGKIIAQLEEEEGILHAELDLSLLAKVQAKLPSLNNRLF